MKTIWVVSDGYKTYEFESRAAAKYWAFQCGGTIYKKKVKK